MKLLPNLETLAHDYDAVFCDVWGVLHNGIAAFPDAVAALKKIRKHGIAVILVTNAPRPHPSVIEQITRLGIGRDVYDRVVTSGDVTRELIKASPKEIYHLGTVQQLVIYGGIDVDLVDEERASVVVCTGLVNDSNETPADYDDLLQTFRKRNLPMICANPDIQIHRGNKLEWCAGALAQAYEQVGGRTFIAGKPYRPIYEAAQYEAEAVLGRELEKSRILGIGDGMFTDIKGAADYGLDVLFISDGVHAAEYTRAGETEVNRMETFIRCLDQNPIAYMHKLA